MTLDSSALIAILVSEAGSMDLIDQILQTDVVRIGTPTLVETSIVLSSRRGKPSHKEVQRLIEELGVTVVPFGESEWQAAASAYDRFGRGKHPAALNFGDCLAYAVAVTVGDSLLFVGTDFSRTDVRRA